MNYRATFKSQMLRDFSIQKCTKVFNNFVNQDLINSNLKLCQLLPDCIASCGFVSTFTKTVLYLVGSLLVL